MTHCLKVLAATEAVAIEASRWVGFGNEIALTEAATRAMVQALETHGIDGRLDLGEARGELADQTRIGTNSARSLAIKTVEGITATSLGGANSLALIAVSEDGTFSSIPPSMYMDKVVVPAWADGVVDLSAEPAAILTALAAQKGVQCRELRVAVLDRPRNQRVIDAIRSAGARVTLIADGDVAVSLAILSGRSPIDCMLGSGGAREAVYTATAARAVGNVFFARFLVRNREEEASLARSIQVDRIRQGFWAADLAPGAVTLAATAITDCAPLQGVSVSARRVHTESFLFQSDAGSVSLIKSTRRIDARPAAGQ